MSRGAVALTNVNTGPTSPLAAAVIEVMYAARSVPASSSARPQANGGIGISIGVVGVCGETPGGARAGGACGGRDIRATTGRAGGLVGATPVATARVETDSGPRPDRSTNASPGYDVQTTGVIPEPATLVLVAFGLAGVMLAKRRV